MTDPAQRNRGPEPGAPLSADPTRDIRLPPLPDRPFPSLPSDWSAAGRTEETRPREGGSEPVASGIPVPSAPGEPTTPSSGPLVEKPTDELGRPPAGVRDRTLTFEGTAAQRWAAGLAATPDPVWSPLPPRSGPVVGPRPRPVPERGRRWPWVVLAAVPVLVIVGTGLWLLLLLWAA
jgi:hypothetical protein